MAWEFIEETTLESAAASVSFTSGLTAYKFFRLTVYILNDTTSKSVYVRLNNDSGSNYTAQEVRGNSTTVSGSRATAAQFTISGPGLATGQSASMGLLVTKPSASMKAQMTVLAGMQPSPVLSLYGGEWNNTADALSRIDVLASAGNFAAGTSILLEGLAF